jgi:kinesin family protein 1
MQISLSAADLEPGEGASSATRPESTTSSSADEADVDWTFAKREAALARLGLDPTLDNLPDEDLNKLFDKISKVKTMRGHGGSKSRPESSLSHVDDIWSESGRPFSSDATTDDSSWDAVQSRGSPQIDDSLKDVQNQLESRLQAIAESSTEAEDLKVEKDHMQHQLKLVQNQMRRLIDARARGETDVDLVHFEPVIYTARQLRLIRKVLDKWRAHRAFSMAEAVLSCAVLIKEANIIRSVFVYPCLGSSAENEQQGTRERRLLQLHYRVRRVVGVTFICS